VEKLPKRSDFPLISDEELHWFIEHQNSVMTPNPRNYVLRLIRHCQRIREDPRWEMTDTGKLCQEMSKRKGKGKKYRALGGGKGGRKKTTPRKKARSSSSASRSR